MRHFQYVASSCCRAINAWLTIFLYAVNATFINIENGELSALSFFDENKKYHSSLTMQNVALSHCDIYLNIWKTFVRATTQQCPFRILNIGSCRM